MMLQRYLRALMVLVMILASLSACESREAVPDERSEGAVPAGFEPVEPSGEEEEEAEPADLSFEAITEGLELFVTEEFIITRPEEDIETTAENFYITGVSDPELPLRMNGVTLEDRGELGSFGAYVPLEMGENRFRFEYGGEEETLIITRVESEPAAPAATITGARPSYDLAVREGEPYTLSCVAPAGAAVTATVGETTLEMTASAETEAEDAPVTFTASFDPAATEGTAELGPVAYIMSWGGDTISVSSPGKLFAVGAEDELLIRMNETAVTTFNEESDESGFYNTLKRGVIDRVDVISYASGMYRLASGGWVFQQSVEPSALDEPYESEVGDVTFQPGEALETVTFHGTATPPYKAFVADGVLSLTLYHTSLPAELDVSGSELIADAAVSDGENGAAIDFTLDMDKYWGYLVQYDGGDTILTLKKRPEPGSALRPLEGVTVALDPGHGGTDNGAAGVALNDGAMEKDVNLAAGIAAQRYLEGLGATVIMTREGDEKLELDAILAFNEEHKPDFFLSLHSNSLSYASDGTEPSGVEIFYYDDGAEPLAEALANRVTEATGRVNRGGKQDYYKVTLCSLSPSVLVEMGFLTNPEEYDSLRSLRQIYNTAVAIGDVLTRRLSGETPPEPEEGAAEEAPEGEG